MIGTIYSLFPPITFRTEVIAAGRLKRRKRPTAEMPPAAPNSGSNAHTFIFTCPITEDYVVAARSDVGGVNGRRVTCYQTFRGRPAALMYALMCGG